jgi:hypothetical protein
MTFEKVLNEVKRLNQARKNNIKMNAGKNNNALYEMNRATIKAELVKLNNKKTLEV